MDEESLPSQFGIRIGRRGTLWDWLAAMGCGLVLALILYNAVWQSHLNKKEAQSKREWDAVWSKRAPGDRVQPWTPDRRFRTPFDKN